MRTDEGVLLPDFLWGRRDCVNQGGRRLSLRCQDTAQMLLSQTKFIPRLWLISCTEGMQVCVNYLYFDSACARHMDMKVYIGSGPCILCWAFVQQKLNVLAWNNLSVGQCIVKRWILFRRLWSALPGTDVSVNFSIIVRIRENITCKI